MKSAILKINPIYHKTKSEISSEEAMINAAKEDSANFRLLYDKYFEMVYRFLFQRLGSEQLADEVTSEVFYKVLSSLQKYEHRGLPFSSWLLRIAHNECVRYFRKNQRSRVVRLQTSHLQNLMDVPPEEDEFKTLKPLLLKALGALKPDDLQLIEMRFFEGRPFKEMAEILDKKESAIKMKVYRLLDKLKTLITQK